MALEWKDAASIVGKAAPILGTLLAGATGGASIAVGALISACLGTDNTPDAITNAIAADPQAALKLAMFESEHQAKLQAMLFAHTEAMAEVEFKLQANEVDDRKSARRAAIDAGTSDKLFWLSVFILVVCVGTEIAVLFLGIPVTTDALIAGRVLGMLDSLAMAGMAYNYGGTASSNRKTELMAQAPAIVK